MAEPQRLGELLAGMERTFEKMRAWQQTPEGIEARRVFEAKQEAKRRAEVDEKCSIRCVPGDVRTRPLALTEWEKLEGEAVFHVYEAMDWRLRKSTKTHRIGMNRWLIGPPGTGKTVALAHAVAHHKITAHFVTATDLNKTRLQRDDEFAARVNKVDLLAIDELGTEERSAEIVLLIQRRIDDGLVTLCASNCSGAEVKERFFAGANGERLADRLQRQRDEGCKAVLQLEGKSMRRHG